MSARLKHDSRISKPPTARESSNPPAALTQRSPQPSNVRSRSKKLIDRISQRLKGAESIPELSQLGQYLAELQKSCEDYSLRLTSQQRKSSKIQSWYSEFQNVLPPLFGVLKRIANDSTDETFQRRYDDFVKVCEKICRLDGKTEKENGVAGDRQALKELKEEQTRRTKIEKDMDLLLIGSKQSILQKQQKLKQMDQLLKSSQTQLSQITKKNLILIKAVEEKTSIIANLQSQLSKAAGQAPVKPLDITLMNSRGINLKSSAASSPHQTQSISEVMMSPLGRSKAKLPPMPQLFSPSNASERRIAHLPDWHQDSLMKYVLMQAFTLQGLLNPKEMT